ncbi:MAG: alpha-amylase family glycosyl hydrolase [Deltaproteobacteria bacterium]|nr:alpha-amylase family glycosyl hydrolase [Deltaproteobacteria bacterium]
MREFHIKKDIRDLLGIDNSLFSVSGNIVFVDLKSARKFVHAYNQKKKKSIKPGEVFTMGIIDEILHYVCYLYRRDVKAHVFDELLYELSLSVGFHSLENLFSTFVEEFPPTPVYSGKISKEEYLTNNDTYMQTRTLLLEELLMLWLANMNPAFSFLSDVINDETLKGETAYLTVVKEIRDFFDKQRPFGPFNQSLVEMLRSPAVSEPHSLDGQLRYILENWGYLLGDFISKIKRGVDVLKEEKVFFFLGPKKQKVYRFDNIEAESEVIEESEWMKDLVLIAKHTYVWLSQLSRKYGKEIQRLDQIPEKEFEALQKWGINGIWLIGLWERSPASKKIKNLCGNKDAIASAYSIYDYTISEDLGGEVAYQTLREKAGRFGIRLGCDMVPNHMGIYSKWMVEKPKWFIYRCDNPYPWYTFRGENLSFDEKVEIYIEDHYYDRTDAAVVLKRVDRETGETIYVYHGNDGTGMPWNDTAQLNYLLPEVRKAMIATIVRVAKKFPIIRFDAAMTLTKMHFQRLWFPEPGKGGAIPTRAEFSMTKEEFDKHMPKEFWREVVEKVKTECGDTLLIAEAFWLLEGYFVKNLGMHRVYNSAFMNMLRDEENAKYRKIIKNTLELDPGILKKFVNFMSNPDEKTAYEQFGDGDKYFGVCTLMITMPGLPMFGHGQIEGFREKYGMEFKRPYLDEKPDNQFIIRQEKEIFPLLRKRYLFSGTDKFFFYDFLSEDGEIDEDVFVFSNMYGQERAVIVFQNKNKVTRGWIKESVPQVVNTSQGKREIRRKSLLEAIGMYSRDQYYLVFKDFRSELEYLFDNGELLEKGLYLVLGPYQCLVFLEAKELREDSKALKILARCSKGYGIKNIDAAIIFITNFLSLIDFELAKKLSNRIIDEHTKEKLWEKRKRLLLEAYRSLEKLTGKTYKMDEIETRFRITWETILDLSSLSPGRLFELVPFFKEIFGHEKDVRNDYICYLLVIWQTIFSMPLHGEIELIRLIFLEALKETLPLIGFSTPDLDSLINKMDKYSEILLSGQNMLKK